MFAYARKKPRSKSLQSVKQKENTQLALAFSPHFYLTEIITHDALIFFKDEVVCGTENKSSELNCDKTATFFVSCYQQELCDATTNW